MKFKFAQSSCAGSKSTGAPKVDRRRGDLDRSSLPDPFSYLLQHGFLTRAPHGEWATIRCPFHKGGEEAHPSLRISLRDGHFKCHACPASGGDLLQFHRLRTGLGFREAVLDLGGRFHD